MLTIEDIQVALARGQSSFDALQALYLRLPPTQCDCETPGVCCRFMPQMTLLEALQWFDVMARMSAGRRAEMIRQFIFFYLVTPLRQPGCPFLEAGGECSIYRERPFACRAYGLWSSAVGRIRTQQHRDGKKAMIQNWQNLGIRVSADAVAFEMDYCTRVHSQTDSPPTDEVIMEVLSEVYTLDTFLGKWRDRFEKHYHSDFSYLLTATLLGARKAVLSKIAVIKEITELGTEQRLKKIVSRVDDQSLSDVFDKLPCNSSL